MDMNPISTTCLPHLQGISTTYFTPYFNFYSCFPLVNFLLTENNSQPLSLTKLKKSFMALYEKHQEAIEKAIEANRERTFYAHYPEHPKVYGKENSDAGEQNFEAMKGKPFQELKQEGAQAWVGEEVSPYTQEKLGITYPKFDADTLTQRAHEAYKEWREIDYRERAGILVEALENIKQRFFEIGFATHHTTGQAFMMAFQASGPHGNDRALEAISMGVAEMEKFPDQAHWQKPMGKMGDVHVKKEWEPVPKGPALAIGVSTFPVWNSVAGVFGSLVTGNPVIWKPHPMAILPSAIEVAEIQKTFEANGINPNVIQLAADEPKNQITKDLAEHPTVKIIDFTGGKEFGDYIERLEQHGKVTFTEKSGVNSMILHSMENTKEAFQNIAFSLCLYSGQMCTAPQNIFVPEGGIEADGEKLSFDDVVQKLTESVQGLVDHPKMGPGTLGAIQNPQTEERLKSIKQKLNGNVALDSKTIVQEGFENARTATPMIATVDAGQEDLFSQEQFGPIALVVKTKDIDHAIDLAKNLTEDKGAITCTAYTTDSNVKQKIKREMGSVFAPVSFNFVGPVWVNLNVAFSDIHLTGGNPAGNAGFSNPEFLQKRFIWVGHKEVVPGEEG